MRILISCVFLLILVFTLGCQNNSDQLKFDSMYFRVNTEYLEESIQDTLLSIEYAPPKGWIEIDKQTLQSLQENMNVSEYKHSTYSLRTMYTDSLKRHLFILGELILPDSLSTISYVNQLVDDAIHEKFKDIEIGKGSFLINGIKTIQYRMIWRDRINYKLFMFINKHMITQIDYAIAQPLSEGLTEQVESSIGSIKGLRE